MSAPEGRKINWVKPVVIVGILVGVIAVLKLFVTPERIEQLNGFVESLGVWGPLVYITVYIAGTLFFLPGFALTAVSGVSAGSTRAANNSTQRMVWATSRSPPTNDRVNWP